MSGNDQPLWPDLIRTPLPKPTPPPGFRLFAHDQPWHLNACVNYSHNPEPSYVEGFRQAAEVLIAEVEHRRGLPDFLVYPIVYCYRQYLELQLKHILRRAKALQIYDKDVPTGGKRAHDLSYLWAECQGVIIATAEFPDEDKDRIEKISEFIEQIMALDPKGFGARYADVGLPGTDHIHLGNLRGYMAWICEWLDIYANWLYILGDLENEAR